VTGNIEQRTRNLELTTRGIADRAEYGGLRNRDRSDGSVEHEEVDFDPDSDWVEKPRPPSLDDFLKASPGE
jgi:hypothetical protein